ncbi:MAG: alkaline phosphatase, partial [Muribaculaceae bacterium]
MKYKSLVLAAFLCIASLINAQPKYIFYFIGDGMGIVPIIAATELNRTVYNGEKPLTMTQFPVSGFCTTYSANSTITDSAAAGTALSTGYKTGNGMLGVAPDSTAVYSIANVLKDNGYGVGVVTTVFADDATPGAFYAHVPSRAQVYDIDCQFIDGKVDFLAGANLKGMKDKEGNPTDIAKKYEANNIKVVYSLDELAKVDKKAVNKGVLLEPNPFNNSNVGFTIDSIPNMLTLPQMTQACLDHLMVTSPDKFFMMIEGGNIDHALHGNDAGTAIKE